MTSSICVCKKKKINYIHIYTKTIDYFCYSSVVNNNFNSGQQVSAAARLSPHSPAAILSFPHPQSPRVTQVSDGTLYYCIFTSKETY